ncbi:MFS transporter, partial [Vibrio fujianensis]
MLSFLYRSHTPSPLTDPATINATYRYWRLHIMLGMYLGYAGFYFTRRTLNYAAPSLLTDLGLDKGDFGLLGTLFYITYGCSKFISGTISDRSNPRYFMGIGLIATGFINIAFGFSSSISAFILLWVLNAWFQGWGWPACSKLLTTWYSRSERGWYWAIWNTAHNVGGALIPIMVGYLTLHFGWRHGFIWPGVIGVLIGLILCWRLRDKPITQGLPKVGNWRNDPLEQAQENEGQGLSYQQILAQYVFTNR